MSTFEPPPSTPERAQSEGHSATPPEAPAEQFRQSVEQLLIERGVLRADQPTEQRSLLIDMLGQAVRDTLVNALEVYAQQALGARSIPLRLRTAIAPLGLWLDPQWATDDTPQAHTTTHDPSTELPAGQHAAAHAEVAVGASFLFAAYSELPEREWRLLLGAGIMLMQEWSRWQAAPAHGRANVDRVGATLVASAGRLVGEMFADQAPLLDAADAAGLIRALNRVAASLRR